MCRCLLFRTPRASNYLASLSHGLQNIILSLTNSIRPPSHPSPLCLPSGEKRHANSLLFCGCLLGIINSCFRKYAFLKRHFFSARAECTFSCLSKYTWWPQRGLSSTHTHTPNDLIFFHQLSVARRFGKLWTDTEGEKGNESDRIFRIMNVYVARNPGERNIFICWCCHGRHGDYKADTFGGNLGWISLASDFSPPKSSRHSWANTARFCCFAGCHREMCCESSSRPHESGEGDFSTMLRLYVLFCATVPISSLPHTRAQNDNDGEIYGYNLAASVPSFASEGVFIIISRASADERRGREKPGDCAD